MAKGLSQQQEQLIRDIGDKVWCRQEWAEYVESWINGADVKPCYASKAIAADNLPRLRRDVALGCRWGWHDDRSRSEHASRSRSLSRLHERGLVIKRHRRLDGREPSTRTVYVQLTSKGWSEYERLTSRKRPDRKVLTAHAEKIEEWLFSPKRPTRCIMLRIRYGCGG